MDIFQSACQSFIPIAFLVRFRIQQKTTVSGGEDESWMLCTSVSSSDPELTKKHPTSSQDHPSFIQGRRMPNSSEK